MAKKKKKKAKKASRKKGGRRRSASRDMLVVGSKVKAYVKEQGAMSSGELAGAVSDEIYRMLDKAIERAHNNKRSTVQPKDL